MLVVHVTVRSVAVCGCQGRGRAAGEVQVGVSGFEQVILDFVEVGNRFHDVCEDVSAVGDAF